MGRVDIGVLTCREAVPDPWLLADGFAEAVADLERAAEVRDLEEAPNRLGTAESAQ
jgi:hypothetical protein